MNVSGMLSSSLKQYDCYLTVEPCPQGSKEHIIFTVCWLENIIGRVSLNLKQAQQP